jgi:DNA-binding beta-propeller fold protein YncE
MFATSGAHAAQGGYHVIRKIALGGEGGWDDLTVDPETNRIYITHGTHVIVLDEASGKVVGDIADMKGVHAIALALDLGRGYISDGGENAVAVFDLKTLKPLGKIKTTGENPDGILYDPETKRIFAFNHKTGNATAIDAITGMVLGTIKTGPSPEGPALDGKGNIFLTLEDNDTLIEIDTQSLKVKNTWPTAPCKGPGPIEMDRAHRRLFLNCQPNKMLALWDADSGKIISSVPIGVQVDGGGFDPASGLVFASCGEGVLTVAHEDSPDRLSPVETVKTQFGARTMALDPKTLHVFVVTSDFAPAGPSTADNPRPRPTIVANTFVLLELAK